MKKRKIVYNLLYVLKLMFKLKKSYLCIVILISILMSIIPYVTLLISQRLMNELQRNTSDINLLVAVLGVYIFIQFISSVITLVNSFYMGKYVEYVRRELSKYYDKLCSKLTVKDFENDAVYDMIKRAEFEIGSRPVVIFNDFINLIKGLIGIALSITILVRWHKWILLGFIILPLVSIKYFKMVSDLEYKVLYERASTQRKEWYLTYLLTKDYYIKEVRTLGLTNYFLSEKFKIKDKLYQQNVDILKKKNFLRMRYQLVNFIFLSVIIFIALFETYYKKIMIGNFMTYVNTSTKVGGHVSSVVDSLFALYSDSLYCKNIIEFINYVENNYERKVKIDEQHIDIIESIELINVSYKYTNAKNMALQNISFKIQKNDIVAIIGENGSGKTTLIKILLGLYDDYEGKILINGIDLKIINKECYRKKISSIFQDYNNYEFTIQDNIRFGDINNIHSISELSEVSKLTSADTFINNLPNKYYQQVGNWFEGGMQLSGGQWQKLALTRGIIRDSDIYIFDEPTSSLDPSSEYNFFKNMLDIFKQKIGIFVTHRFTNAKIANKILVFKEGEIIEFGTHDEFISNHNYYYEMYLLQHEGIYKNIEK